MTRKRRRLKKKYRRILTAIFYLTFIIIISLSIKNIFNWNKDNKKINNIEKKLDNITVEKIANNEKIGLVDEQDKSDPYWDYVKLPLINVDFNELKNINDEIVAFIKVNGTNINYPVVQTNDNKFYLTHTLDKSYNEAGWVFSDYRNDLNNFKSNSIIYAHGRLNKTMFGSLKDTLKKEWYSNPDNHVIYLDTPTYSSLWQVFSLYTIKTESYYLTTEFSSEKSKINFLNTIIKRSIHNFNVSLSEESKIITLSTCKNDEEKIVMHARLIKTQKK